MNTLRDLIWNAYKATAWLLIGLLLLFVGYCSTVLAVWWFAK